jgi:hypothetical protein
MCLKSWAEEEELVVAVFPLKIPQLVEEVVVERGHSWEVLAVQAVVEEQVVVEYKLEAVAEQRKFCGGLGIPDCFLKIPVF